MARTVSAGSMCAKSGRVVVSPTYRTGGARIEQASSSRVGRQNASFPNIRPSIDGFFGAVDAGGGAVGFVDLNPRAESDTSVRRGGVVSSEVFCDSPFSFRSSLFGLSSPLLARGDWSDG